MAKILNIMTDFKTKELTDYIKERLQYVANCNTPKDYINKSDSEILAFFNILVTLNHEAGKNI